MTNDSCMNKPAACGLFFVRRKVMTVTNQDGDVLARTLWREARAEGLAWLQAGVRIGAAKHYTGSQTCESAE
jgi:hypothetical protein